MPIVEVNVRIKLCVLSTLVVATVVAQPNVISLQIFVTKLSQSIIRSLYFDNYMPHYLNKLKHKHFTPVEYFTNAVVFS